jgi:hypothetical protein
VLNDLGSLTVVDLLAVTNIEEYKHLVREWATCVWEACSEQHELAREWVRTALGSSKI